MQFVKGIEETRHKAQSLSGDLEELDPSSIETYGAWLEELDLG